MVTGKKPRVLLAEDELHCRELMKAVLRSMNCEIAGEATNGAKAVELFLELKPDMMFLDINMPFMTGDEVLKEIQGKSPGTFIIVLTSMTDSTTVAKCLELGAANYIRKDTPVEEIKSIIRESWKAFRKKA